MLGYVRLSASSASPKSQAPGLRSRSQAQIPGSRPRSQASNRGPKPLFQVKAPGSRSQLQATGTSPGCQAPGPRLEDPGTRLQAPSSVPQIQAPRPGPRPQGQVSALAPGLGCRLQVLAPSPRSQLQPAGSRLQAPGPGCMLPTPGCVWPQTSHDLETHCYQGATVIPSDSKYSFIVLSQSTNQVPGQRPQAPDSKSKALYPRHQEPVLVVGGIGGAINKNV